MAAGTTSNISLASNALLLLGDQPISSFDENTTGATLATNLYESSYYSMLTTYRWRFATKKGELARLSSTPKNTWNYKFKLPTDLLYVIDVIETDDYEIYEDQLFCNRPVVSIDYIYKLEEDRLPAYFVKAFEFFLASQFALPLTGNLDKAAFMSRAYEQQLKLAKFADATQRPLDVIQDNPYVDIRY